MNKIKNQVQLIGNIGKDMELKKYPNDVVKAFTSLATNEKYKNAKGDLVENTQWHNIICWGKIAESMEKHCKKGKEILVTGKISNRSYKDKDGNMKFTSEVIVNNFLLLEKPESIN